MLSSGFDRRARPCALTPADSLGSAVESADPAFDLAIAAPGRRIILLSGQALVRNRSTYLMEGTLFASSSGALEGEILWTAAGGYCSGAAGAEWVRGAIGPAHLRFSGYKAERPFITERYRLTLFGAEAAGVFEGASEAYGEWDARLSGRYQIVNERS
ncbi:MAG: hypothetical protein A4S17_12070 [Proteobacteria bacterium HN_bin10]|nr:MAG: hypothetical protein A4S17_12070 [Proteobacteria bacterium HN_bin10]